VISLLDVNVLVALFDPAHVYHEAAHAWFGVNRIRRWATCPLTENALVRVLSNPRISWPAHGGGGCGLAAADLLFESRPCLLGDSISMRDHARFHWNRIQGHRQLTDVYLLALSVSNEGRLATFDSAISIRSVQAAKPPHLELVAA
jgi:uncharacterized protein